ncbi:MAG: Mut7-C RNAse domain-containing protein [Candidatus Omnitrophica bacterium]|nr:Mut7-C RNAse domain-containing protein [Candidatus Omnitrophota bacterium]
MKFLVTPELGRLCRWLRILGLDVFYAKSGNRSEIIFKAIKESRIIVTRDRRIGEHHGLKIILIKSDFLKEQLRQLINETKIEIKPEAMFMRCTICNEILVEIDKETVKGKVPEYVYATQEEFVQCPQCKRIYWEGTHWGRITKTLEEIAGIS